MKTSIQKGFGTWALALLIAASPLAGIDAYEMPAGGNARDACCCEDEAAQGDCACSRCPASQNPCTCTQRGQPIPLLQNGAHDENEMVLLGGVRLCAHTPHSRTEAPPVPPPLPL